MGRKAEPVRVITSADLIDNGGQYRLISKDAIKVSGDDTLEIMGGSPIVVYPVPVSEIGDYNLIQGEPIHVAEAPVTRGQDSSLWAYPVYHVGPRTWPAAAAPTLDQDYLVYEGAMAVAPTETWRTAANQLFVDLQDVLGVTTLSDAFDFAYILAAETSQVALLNMVSPGTYDATNVNSMAFEASRGFTGNGSSSYLNTNAIVDLLSWYTRTNACFGVYSRTNLNANVVDMGVEDSAASGRAFQQIRSSGLFTDRVNNVTGTALAVANPDSLGFYTSNRSAHTAQQSYKNGVSLGSVATSSSAVAEVEFFIGARNSGGTPLLFSTRQYAFAFAGRSMNTTEQANFYTAIQSFMTAIGADVVGSLPAAPLVESEPLTDVNQLGGVLLAQQGINPTSNFGAYAGL